MNQTLKKNDYKYVTLRQSDDGELFVGKAYSNQGAEQDRKNTVYINQALNFFYTNFSNCVRIPKPLGVDLDKCEITMEYLHALPRAKHLRLSQLDLAKAFFHACYQHTSNSGFLRSIQDSVIMNSSLEKLLDTDFPLCLGFKGDLSENLVLGGGELILADIDSICIEPLGLSELIIYADHFSSSWLFPALRYWLKPPPPPVALEYLNRTQLTLLINATLGVLNARMSHISEPLKTLKYSLANRLLSRYLR